MTPAKALTVTKCNILCVLHAQVSYFIDSVQVKDQLSGTADALSSIQSTSASVKRSRDKYHQLCLDAERLRKSAATAKDVERVSLTCNTINIL